MKLNVMREFVKLAENKNFSKTAEELYIAQSALSRHMTALEEELRVQLIKRTRNSFELTEAGEITRDEFAKLLGSYENMLDKLSRLDTTPKGEIHLGVLYYDMEFYVAKIRQTFHDRYPNVKLYLHSFQPEQLENALLSGKIDGAIIYGVNDCRRKDIEHLPFLKLPYSLIYYKDHRFSKMKDIQLSDLNGEKLLVPAASFEINHVCAALNKMLEQGGVRHLEKIPVSNYDEVPWLMKETGAIYLSPMANIHAYGSDTESRFFFPERCSSDVSLVWNAGQQNPAVKLLCSAIKICFP